MFVRLSVLQSISGIFPRFFLLHCTCIFSFPHKISSFFCSRPYYYAVSQENFFRISFVFFRCCLMFLYKTFWNLYKTEYFLYKNRRKFQHVFSGPPVFFYSGFRIFWGAFPAFLSERVRFSHLPIRFFKRVFYLVGYDSLVSFPSVCLILRILLIKNPFFFRMNHPSGYASFLFSSGYFHIFSDAPADFSVLPRILFCIFSVRLQKIICCFFIRIIRFLRFFRFVGIIFPAFFMWS